MDITNDLTQYEIDAKLLILKYKVDVEKSSKELLNVIEDKLTKLESEYNTEDISSIPAVFNTREAYKVLGKSPSSYRNAAEAMLRRIVSGKGLYRINNIVDINNLVSISTGYSIGSYDVENLNGEIIWKKAEKDEHYKGIGKDLINVENLPTLYDEVGAFGNPTSDSSRAMISSGVKEVISVVYSFSGDKDFKDIESYYKELLSKFCNVNDITVEYK